MDFTGKIVGETKVKNAEGMKVTFTLENKIFCEFAEIDSEVKFDELCKLVDIGKNIKITLRKM